MKFIEKFFESLGYVRAQTKPNSFPFHNKVPIHNDDLRDRIMNPGFDSNGPNQSGSDWAFNQPITTSPEQISGEPRMPNPERDIEKFNEGEVVDLRPYNDQPVEDPSGLPTNTTNINEMQINPNRILSPNNPSDELGDLRQIKRRDYLGIKEIKAVNETLGLRMEKLGILTVDKTVFMDRFNKLHLEACKIAIKTKIPISEALDGLLG